MGLRNKLSKKEVKKSKAVPTLQASAALPPLPLPLVRPSSPLLPRSASTLLHHSNSFLRPSSTLSTRNSRQHHRRSRSFSELVHLTSSISTSDDDRAHQHSDQPWRSHAAWTALHSTSSGQTSRRVSPDSLLLPTPTAMPQGMASGWRGRGVGGFFAGGMMVGQDGRPARTRQKTAGARSERRESGGSASTSQRTQSPILPETRDNKLDGSPNWTCDHVSNTQEWKPGTASLLYRLKSQSRAHPHHPLTDANSHSILAPALPIHFSPSHYTPHAANDPDEMNIILSATPCSPSTASTYTPPIPSPSLLTPSKVQAGETTGALLPPLTPQSVQSLRKSSSFTSLRAPDSPPIPWGRRGSTDAHFCAASPRPMAPLSPRRSMKRLESHRSQPPVSVGAVAATSAQGHTTPKRGPPRRALPLPPSPSPPSSPHELSTRERLGPGCDFDASGSSSSHETDIRGASSPSPSTFPAARGRERLTTPETPEVLPVDILKRSGKLNARPAMTESSDCGVSTRDGAKIIRGSGSLRSIGRSDRQGSWEEERGMGRGGWI